MLGGNINATERDSFTEQVFRLIPKYLKNRVYESARKICENHNDKSKAFYLTHQITAIDEFLRTNNLCVNSQVESILSLSQKKESR